MTARSVRRPVRTVDVIVIGAGHCGLAMSHALSGRGIEHLVLERGEVAHSWRTERWDSLRLLTPNWMSRLPGHAYGGEDPDGYMSARQVVDFITDYAAAADAPVLTHTTVERVAPCTDGYRVETTRGVWNARAVVLASGACNRPQLPRCVADVPAGVTQLSAHAYRNPGQVPDGGVLVVGASATGLQLADELSRSGRLVTLAVGEHVRMPRRYRGHDIQHWLHVCGVLDQRIEEVDDVLRARRVPSPQLVGSPDRRTLDLNALRARGVDIVGRVAGVRDGRVQFSGSLRNVCALADLKCRRLLDTIDAWATARGLDHALPPPDRPAPTAVPRAPRLGLSLGHDVRSVVWATGFRPDYAFLDAPVLDPRGRLIHDRGVVAPGLYALGLPYLRRRKSSFIHGAEDDVRELSAHLAHHLAAGSRRSGGGQLGLHRV